MRKSMTAYVALFILPFVIGHGSEGNCAQQSIISAESVWNFEGKGISYEEGRKIPMEALMQKYGASPQAIAFVRLAKKYLKENWYLESFKKMGRVDFGTINFPFKNQPDEVYVLLNGNPIIIDVTEPKYWRHLNFKKNPWVRKYPQADWGARLGFKQMVPRPGGGQRFIFSFTISAGGRQGPFLGSANVAYDFDTSGQFLGTKLLGYSKD